MPLGHYPLRLPSYRSAYGRRYHPYPAAQRSINKDALVDSMLDFDYGATEPVLNLPPSLQLHPVRRDDDDGDVTTFQLDAGLPLEHSESKVAIIEKTHVREDENGDDGRSWEHVERVDAASSRLTVLFALLCCLHHIRRRLAKRSAMNDYVMN